MWLCSKWWTFIIVRRERGMVLGTMWEQSQMVRMRNKILTLALKAMSLKYGESWWSFVSKTFVWGGFLEGNIVSLSWWVIKCFNCLPQKYKNPTTQKKHITIYIQTTLIYKKYKIFKGRPTMTNQNKHRHSTFNYLYGPLLHHLPMSKSFPPATCHFSFHMHAYNIVPISK
jgi:hypothetical protein